MNKVEIFFSELWQTLIMIWYYIKNFFCPQGDYGWNNWPPAVSVIVLLTLFLGIFVLGMYFEKHR